MNSSLASSINSRILSAYFVGIPLINTTTYKIRESKYLFEIVREIQPQESLNNFKEKIERDMPKIQSGEYIIIYNPDKWKYHIFYFIDDLSKVETEKGIIYNILHISQEKTDK
ncbi:DUF4865 family protein [Clostridium sp.]|uniref:DUF4865 family protein n=1 Tax=Clostridium sp. TaxID=1506 RepID=UPI00283C493B|nr:DUF4865 family protein [Clostridium sp.]MDR3597116.1 DUF4865 family protein [Clostridium sp.]